MNPSEVSLRGNLNVCDLDAGDKPGKDDRKIWVKSFMGYPIHVGKNAFSNEALIQEHKSNLDHKSCIWLHALCSKGPHVILCTLGREYPTGSVLQEAAIYAVKGSKTGAREVSYAPIQDVYKPVDAPIGVYRTWRVTTIKL